MVFSSRIFLFLFLPLFFAVYFVLPNRFRNFAILFFSIFFYVWGEPKFILFILASTVFDYALSLLLVRTRAKGHRTILLIVGVASNILLLVYFKYVNFFVESVNALLSTLGLSTLSFGHVLLPLALSFVVFEKITYLVDIFRGIGKPARTLWDYATYVMLFPKLIAGPIIKYHDIEDQIVSRQHTTDAFINGCARFVQGLGKKVFIADTMGEIVDVVFATPDAAGVTDAWLGALCFSLQIYADFSAYSDMAIGLMRAMGFTPKENFNLPYISRDFTEFWRRWHISLSTFIRDYLYIPLGGNRCGVARQFANLAICFLLSGLWHGANWTFVVWGAYHGFFICGDKVRRMYGLDNMLPRAGAVALTYFFVVVGWVVFRSSTLTNAGILLHKMFLPQFADWNICLTAPLLTANIFFMFAVGMVISFAPASTVFLRFRNRIMSAPIARWGLTLGLFVLSVGIITVKQHVTFIYFRF